MSSDDTRSTGRVWLTVAIGLALVYGVAFSAIFEGVLEPIAYREDVAIATALVTTFGVGFLIGHWSAVALALAPAVASLVGGGGWGPKTYSILLFVVPVLAATLAAAVLARRLAERTSARRGRPPNRRSLLAAGAVMTAMGGLPFALAAYRHVRPLDRTPAKPLTIDERIGQYGGVQLGDRYTRVTELRGAPSTVGDHPFKLTQAELLSGSLKYPGVAFLIYRQHIETIEVTASNAQTRRGVGTGDNLGIAERRYSGMRCGDLNDNDAEYASLWVCTGPVGRGLYMSFYEDPIRKMFLTTNPRRLEWP